MADVSLEMLPSLIQRVLDDQGAMRQDIGDIRKQVGVMSGRISLVDRRLNTILDAVKSGADVAGDLQNQIDTSTERIDRLEHSHGK